MLAARAPAHDEAVGHGLGNGDAREALTSLQPVPGQSVGDATSPRMEIQAGKDGKSHEDFMSLIYNCNMRYRYIAVLNNVEVGIYSFE